MIWIENKPKTKRKTEKYLNENDDNYIVWYIIDEWSLHRQNENHFKMENIITLVT